MLTLMSVFRCRLADLGRPYSRRREKEVSIFSPSRSWYLPPPMVVIQWVDESRCCNMGVKKEGCCVFEIYPGMAEWAVR